MKNNNTKTTILYISLFLITSIAFYIYNFIYALAIIYPSFLLQRKNHNKNAIIIHKNKFNPLPLSFIPILIFSIIMLYIFNFDTHLFIQLKNAVVNLHSYLEHNKLYNLTINDSKLKMLINLIPSIASGYAILITYITAKLMYKIEKRECYFKVPDYYLPVFISTGFLIIFHNSILKLIGINSLVIFGILFFLQGLDIVNYLMNRHMNKKNFFRIIIYVIILSQLLFIILITLIGIFDNWFNFMKYVDMKKK
jgi:hypothetical protein